MASNIISETIDEEYPVAGQDNNSQGFRDNFSLIKTGLATAATEITDLQNNAARTDGDNSFFDNQISRAVFSNTSEEFYQGGTISAGVEVNYQNGLFQSFKVENFNLNLTLTNFPTDSLGKITVELYGDGTDRDVEFLTPGGDLKTTSEDHDTVWKSGTGGNNQITVNDPLNPVVFEFWSYNGGSTVFGRYLGYYTAS